MVNSGAGSSLIDLMDKNCPLVIKHKSDDKDNSGGSCNNNGNDNQNAVVQKYIFPIWIICVWS